jgi:hypothetical protein
LATQESLTGLSAYECFAVDGIIDVEVRERARPGGHPEHAVNELALLLTDGNAVVES